MCYTSSMRLFVSSRERVFAQELRQRSAGLACFADVIEAMERIQSVVGRDDGVWWFTELYRQVTCEVRAHCATGFFAEPAWMEELVIQFSRLYFDALWLWFSHDRWACPPSWAVFFHHRFLLRKKGYSPLQFALAGVNAHIQRDLGFAAHITRRLFPRDATRDARIYQDYVRVNAILERVEVGAMRSMATGWVKRVSEIVHPVDAWLAMGVIRIGRWMAWRTAALYFWLVRRCPRVASVYLALVERSVATVGRLLLIPTFS
ncbi:MAG: hypothetical protein QG668_576 [Patescibacteria group bacterium]|nr:hypothetical protein [Patescibacteria group bacterium]